MLKSMIQVCDVIRDNSKAQSKIAYQNLKDSDLSDHDKIRFVIFKYDQKDIT